MLHFCAKHCEHAPCPVLSIDTGEHYSWEEPVHISFLVILVRVRGVELAIPGSAVECFTTEPNPLAV